MAKIDSWPFMIAITIFPLHIPTRLVFTQESWFTEPTRSLNRVKRPSFWGFSGRRIRRASSRLSQTRPQPSPLASVWLSASWGTSSSRSSSCGPGKWAGVRRFCVFLLHHIVSLSSVLHSIHILPCQLRFRLVWMTPCLFRNAISLSSGEIHSFDLKTSHLCNTFFQPLFASLLFMIVCIACMWMYTLKVWM